MSFFSLKSISVNLALLCFLCGCTRTPTPESEGYIPPTLSGWQQDAPNTNENDGRSLVYRKVVGRTKLRLKFSLLESQTKDAQALRDDVQKGLAEARKASASLVILEQNETQFRGFPAILTQTRDDYRGAKRERKILRVADGKQLFWIDQTLTGNPIEPAARQEADAAWKTFTEGLRISDGS